jgi:CubicO group peptidase (beta-lactamase class C family)
MSTSGLSKQRLGRMHEVLAGSVQRGEVPGLVSVLSRRGEVAIDTIGVTAVGGDQPMRSDTIFRITSMTKPVTAVAAMILVEDCVLRLDDPVDGLLPELADRRVLRRFDGPLDDTVPAGRPITLRDLLTFRLGLGMVLAPPGTYPIQRAESELGLATFGPPKPATVHAPDEWMRRLSTLPLMYQPGEQWLYNTGSHVLGVLIARASGQPLEAFLRERIFIPLGMKDTGFSVPAADLGRLATTYQADPATGVLEVCDGVDDSQWARPPVFPDGAAGLVSTADDFVAFGQMILNLGTYGGERVLSRPSVELMTTNHVPPAQRAAASPILQPNAGWGFGVSVTTARENTWAPAGRYGWYGGFSTSWGVDPSERLTGTLLAQRMMFTPAPSSVVYDFWTSAYAAIDD